MTADLLLQLGVASLAFIIGGFVKGTLGVGLPLVAIPIAATVMPPAQAIALTLVPILVSNVWQVFETGYLGKAAHRFAPVLLALLVGLFCGGLLLSRIEVSTSILILGGVLIAFCFSQLMPLRLAISTSTERWLGPPMGFISGLIGGVSGSYGAVLMSYLMMLRLPKNEFVGSIGLIYLVGLFGLGLALSANQLIGWKETIGTLLALIPTAFGLWLGRRLRPHVSQVWFHRLLIAVLFIIGVSLIRRSGVVDF